MAERASQVAGSVTEHALAVDFPVVPETRLPLVPVRVSAVSAPDVSAKAVLVIKLLGDSLTVAENKVRLSFQSLFLMTVRTP